MSEEILKALMQLFALLTKQDGGVEENEESYVRNFLKAQLGNSGTEEYYRLFQESAGTRIKNKDKGSDRTSVLDSVRILGICRKINKTLNQSQKIIVLVRLFELLGSERKLTQQRLSIIQTISEVFRVNPAGYKSIKKFVLSIDATELHSSPEILCLDTQNTGNDKPGRLINSSGGDICFLRLTGLNLYFLRYLGNKELFLNGLSLNTNRIYLFAKGSTLRLPHEKPLYYSDISSYFLDIKPGRELFFEAKDIDHRFKTGYHVLKDISFSARHGNMVGIMGPSGAGKSTLLNILSGNYKPASGKVTLNGYPVDSPEIKGSIGYVPEDDLLVEELTVFENLCYNARLCFRDLPDEEIKGKTVTMLDRLGLLPQKDQKAGNAFNKMISGGQRKRLNIALELIREPSVLLLDEPTSGLSSRDSENVMDLLRELTLSGKLIFVVIHQPSSELYKMLDKVILLDEGGYLVYYGNPVEALIHFKTLDEQVNSSQGECPVCGNVNPEQIFNIIEARVVDEYGNYTKNRKVLPWQWKELFLSRSQPSEIRPVLEKPLKSLQIPGWLKQTRIFMQRDFLSKLGNRQYIALSLLVSPILGFILSYIIRYISDPSTGKYVFRENENIPVFIFMTLIVAVFIGLIQSAEEIFRDRKILKRERFLSLSRSSYLISKILILFSISAIQALLFVLVANSILEIKNMNFAYWLAFFTTAAFANMLGLNISSAFNSAVTIYIVIPLLIVPMMVLSGAMFPFDKLNHKISRLDKVPLLAELMPTRWSYEALMVNQFKNNYYEQVFYELDKKITNADFMLSYYLPELESVLRKIKIGIQNHSPDEQRSNLEILKNELTGKKYNIPEFPAPGEDFFDPDNFSMEKAETADDLLQEMKLFYLEVFTRENNAKTNLVNNLVKNLKTVYYSYLDDFHNESVAEQVRKIYEKRKIIKYNGHLVRTSDPVFQDPVPKHMLDFRTHFFAPRKHFLGIYMETFIFNLAVIWLLCLVLYVSLYFNWLNKVIHLNSRIFFRRRRDEMNTENSQEFLRK